MGCFVIMIYWMSTYEVLTCEAPKPNGRMVCSVIYPRALANHRNVADLCFDTAIATDWDVPRSFDHNLVSA